MSATPQKLEALRSLRDLPHVWKPATSFVSVQTANSRGSSPCSPRRDRMKKSLGRRTCSGFNHARLVFVASPTPTPPPTSTTAAPTTSIRIITAPRPPSPNRVTTSVLLQKDLFDIGTYYGYACRNASRSFSSTRVADAPDFKPKHALNSLRIKGNAAPETGTPNLESKEKETDIALATGPPPPEGPLSIVFTDIVKSTAMWEKNTTAMSRAMSLHDASIRSLLQRNHGYEVKQNGDGFMIAFSTATSAVQFCLDVQEELLAERWPAGILDLPSGKTTLDDEGHVLFRGLKLRMSAHWGTPVCNWNEIIERMDYLGPMVNRAARFIEVTEPGQIVVSEDFLLRLQGELADVAKDESVDRFRTPEETKRTKEDARSLAMNVTLTNHQSFAIKRLGHHRFKGLDDPQTLYFLVPGSLEGRMAHWHRVKHVAGVKGNVRSDSGRRDGGKDDD
ncbi:hypothetical protein PV08_00098 [Exophiala spinifera]|uniref:Guanylate cyclase domain-containing protein n=1 Tax=Exophiala spinifera TaxID=91928 RepID=A0A0D1YWA0_9EURO|nr:uncharacterized protein PV08_00098 [Exophiala spinifera]KIW19526.1 hypothetical protein PV08_00098 [Exophiala spinifera]